MMMPKHHVAETPKTNLERVYLTVARNHMAGNDDTDILLVLYSCILFKDAISPPWHMSVRAVLRFAVFHTFRSEGVCPTG